jgi:WhiB family redox-sensing transcriptional regulator
MCRGCPVLIRCREYALAAQEPYGVWGGLGEQERRHVIAQRRGATRAA